MEHFVVQREVDATWNVTTIELQTINGVMQSVPVQRPARIQIPVVVHCILESHGDEISHWDGVNYDPSWTKPGIPKFQNPAQADEWMDKRQRVR